jgi:hypothetical protein
MKTQAVPAFTAHHEKPYRLSAKKSGPAALSTLRKLAASRLAPWGHVIRWRDPFGRPALAGMPESFSQFGRCTGCGQEILIAQQSKGGTCSDRMAGRACRNFNR